MLCGATVQDLGAPGQGERIGDRGSEPVRQTVGVIGDQVQRYRLRPAPGDEGEQIESGGLVCGEAVEGHRP